MATATAPFPAPAIWQTDPERIKRIAVVKGAQMYAISPDLASGEMDEIYPGDTLRGGLVRWWMDQGYAAIWLCPPHLADWVNGPDGMISLLEEAPLNMRAHPLTDGGKLAGIVVQRERGGVPMGIYLADGGDGNPWGILPHASRARIDEIAMGLVMAARTLAMQLRYSPSYLGLQMLRQELSRKRYEIPAISEETFALVRSHLPTYVQWMRPISLNPEHFFGEPIIIRKYDRNSSFVASAGEVPVGEPVKVTQFVPKHPGLYRVTTWPYGPDDHLPGRFHIGEGAGLYPWGKCETWAWEPQIRAALIAGWAVQIEEGYYWPEKHDLFRSWRERLWAARTHEDLQQGDAVGAIAGGIIKKVGVAAIGRLNQKRSHAVMLADEAEEEGRRILHYGTDEQGEWTGLAEVVAELGKTDLLRPDWWAAIIAGANERMMSAIYAHQRAWPVAAYVDAVYCLGAWASEDLAPDRLGKWKLERETPVSRQQVAELNSLSAAAWVKKLAAVAREQGQEAEQDGESETAE